jgi:hypothetical protein
LEYEFPRLTRSYGDNIDLNSSYFSFPRTPLTLRTSVARLLHEHKLFQLLRPNSRKAVGELKKLTISDIVGFDPQTRKQRRTPYIVNEIKEPVFFQLSQGIDKDSIIGFYQEEMKNTHSLLYAWTGICQVPGLLEPYVIPMWWRQ